MITLIDNYDSFTYNLYHYLSSREKVVIIKNDQVSKSFNTIIKSKGIVISPGPSTPFNSGECLSLVHKIYSFMPILGVCLGHQILGVYFGARIMTLKNPMHGKVSEIITQNKFKLYENLSKLAELLQQLFGVKTGTQNLSLIWISKVGEKHALKYQRGIRWGAAFRFLKIK